MPLDKPLDLEPYNQRATYSALYGKDAWTHAVALAGRHRTRAQNEYGVTEHFTAAEWLDLCARWDFRCPFCRAQASLTPHHLRHLSKGGSNAVNNVLPCCSACHELLHGRGIVSDPDWLPAQVALSERFHVGDLVDPTTPRSVRPRAATDPPTFVVTEVLPPTRRGYVPASSRWEVCRHDGLHVAGGEAALWSGARARVVPCSYRYRGDGELAYLADLVRVEVGPRMEALGTEWSAQQLLYWDRGPLFAVGDWVTFGAGRHGVVLEIAAPALELRDLPLVDAAHVQVARWPSLCAAAVTVKWINRKGLPAASAQRLSLTQISAAETPPPLDPRWQAAWEAWTGRAKPRKLAAILGEIKQERAARRRKIPAEHPGP